MISAVAPKDPQFLQQASGPDPYEAIHTARYRMYGADSGPPRFWRACSPQGIGLLSLAGDTLAVSGRVEDPEELAAFCAICGAQKLRGERQTLEQAVALLGWDVQRRTILSAAGPLCPAGRPDEVCQPPLEQVYLLLRETFGLPEDAFAPWYCEVSHKIRHGMGIVLGVQEKEQLAATAGIYYQNDAAALIASVATRPAFRGRGYAGALVFALAEQAKKRGVTPFVICHNPAAIRLYERVGFSGWGEEWLCSRPQTGKTKEAVSPAEER